MGGWRHYAKQEAMQIGCENGKVDVFSILRK